MDFSPLLVNILKSDRSLVYQDNRSLNTLQQWDISIHDPVEKFPQNDNRAQRDAVIHTVKFLKSW